MGEHVCERSRCRRSSSHRVALLYVCVVCQSGGKCNVAMLPCCNAAILQEVKRLLQIELKVKHEVDQMKAKQKLAEGELMKFRRTLGIINGAMSTVQVSSPKEIFEPIDKDQDGKTYEDFAAVFGSTGSAEHVEMEPL